MQQLNLLSQNKSPPTKITSVTPKIAPNASCNHDDAIPGLDAYWCPSCQKSIDAKTLEYKRLMRQ